MSASNATINVRPSAGAKHEMSVEMITARRTARGDDFKYNYDFGIKRTDDGLIDFKQDFYQWRTPYDVELLVRCDAPGNELIHFVNIKADHSSNEHDAKIVGGGIGQRYIELLVTAHRTYWFKYDAQFYGSHHA